MQKYTERRFYYEKTRNQKDYCFICAADCTVDSPGHAGCSGNEQHRHTISGVYHLFMYGAGQQLFHTLMTNGAEAVKGQQGVKMVKHIMFLLT